MGVKKITQPNTRELTPEEEVQIIEECLEIIRKHNIPSIPLDELAAMNQLNLLPPEFEKIYLKTLAIRNEAAARGIAKVVPLHPKTRSRLRITRVLIQELLDTILEH